MLQAPSSISRFRSYFPLLAGSLVVALACDDGSGDREPLGPLPGDGGAPGDGMGDDGSSGADGSDGGDTGGGGDDGATGDGGATDGSGPDDGGTGDEGNTGDDGGSDGAVECPAPATQTHTGHFLFSGPNPDTSIANGVRKITGELIIDGTNLTNLDFLACLEEVGGRINVFDNDELTNLGGLSGITTLTDPSGELAIAENDALTTISGLGKLAAAGNLSINNNNALQNLQGLATLGTVNANLTIRYNPSLASVSGLESLTVVGQKFNVVGNPSLPCGDIAELGDRLNPKPNEAIWCEGNLGCEALPACGS